MPREIDAALRAEELARRLVVVDEIEAGRLGARGDLQVQVRRQGAAQRRQRLVTHLGHLAGAIGKRDLDELAIRIELKQQAFLFERVERAFERDLPVIPPRFPAILGPADRLAAALVAAESRALVRSAAAEGHDQRRYERRVLPVANADQL